MAPVYIGLGSNLGDRLQNIDSAKKKLLSSIPVRILKEGSIEETEPVDYFDQPKFINQVILIETDLRPNDLLFVLLEIEKKLGRIRTIKKGPRIIDMDMLLYDDIIMDTEDLILPHPGIINRQFLIRQLLEINADLIDPKSGKRYKEIEYEKNKKH
jgi:dihydroneopterin aldolase / 2-amino-4-hydroxy-6-hydroxymethyldihydropteridine diphosphokinase